MNRIKKKKIIGVGWKYRNQQRISQKREELTSLYERSGNKYDRQSAERETRIGTIPE